MSKVFERCGWFGAIRGWRARHLRWGLALFAMGVVLFASTAEARVYHVVKDATGTGDTWDNALGAITAGLTAATMGEEVWVKSATYEEAVSLKTGVALYGGFAGNETARGERDWVANVTVIDASGTQTSAVTASYVNGATLDGFVITGGSGLYGGGVGCNDSSPTLANCTITENTAKYGGGGVYCQNSSPTLTNCTITCNTAKSDNGGGVYCNGSSLTLTNCTITGNTTMWYGGGVSCRNSSPTLTNCTITGNTAGGNGGGVYCDGSSPTLTNCTITVNSGRGGGVSCRNSSPTLTNCTIAGNDGASVYCSDSSPTLTNCIVWNRGAELAGGSVDTAVVRYCSVQGGWSGEGNRGEYPMFVNPDAGDYHLQNGSPCIDRGLVEAAPDRDIEGHLRPGVDGLVDIGAYESEDAYTPGTVPPRVVYIREGAAPGGDGGSWSTAFPSIGAALFVTGATDEVWVAAGRYGEAIELEPGLAVYGGFAGNETTREERDWSGNVTVIDATGTGWSTVTARSGYVNDATLDGFVITGGSAGVGGGVYCQNSSPALTNCTITGNTAGVGGGVYCQNSSPTLTTCTITGNRATGKYGGSGGGGVSCSGSSPTLTDCTIAGNTADDGGGVYCDGSSPTLTNCTISGNTASSGGGISCRSSSSPTLTNCSIADNSGHNGGGVYCWYKSAVTLRRCIITGNSADWGGGAYSWAQSALAMTNCRITDNSAHQYGGAVLCGDRSSASLANCTIAGNSAGCSGSGLEMSGDSSAGIVNCILWNRGSEIAYTKTDSVQATYSCIQGGWPGASIIDQNPLFAGIRQDFHLQNRSPCIKRGRVSSSPAEDLEGNPRPGGDGLVDMGAYETPDGYEPGPWKHVPQRYFVRSGTTAEGDGLGWNSAFAAIESALEVVSTSDEVWVAGGEYREVVYMEPTGSLYGGFSGTESLLAERHWTANDTIINATGLDSPAVVAADKAIMDGFIVTGGVRSGLTCVSASPVVRNCDFVGNSSNSSGGGVYCFYASPRFTNCTITRGSAIEFGGGMFCYSSSPTLTDCTIEASSSKMDGGGVYFYSATSSLTNCTISGNSAAQSLGGGVYCSSSSPSFTGCTISGNSGSGGGGLHSKDSSPVLTRCTISANSAEWGGGASCSGGSLGLSNCTISGNSAQGDGGGVDSGGEASLVLTQCTITGNSARDFGGGVYCGTGRRTLTNCIIAGNSALEGGGVYFRGASSVLTNCSITANSANYCGGGVYCHGSSPTLTNCTITGNSASRDGGGVYEDYGLLNLLNCTIARNSANHAGSGLYVNNGSAVIENCILWNRGAEIFAREVGKVKVTYSCVQGGWVGEGNIDANPLFLNPKQGDFHLRNGSPCITAALLFSTPRTDMEGNPRPGADGLADMGAYESQDGYEPGPAIHIPRRHFVRSDRTEGGDGSTWSSAFTSIESALEVVSTSDEVWVAEGEYREVVYMEPTGSLYGGFSGTESLLAERDWTANEAIINATGLDSPVVVAADKTVLDGFVIAGGGYGLVCFWASPVVANCIITDNSLPGLSCEHSSPTLTNCTITGNTANYGGGVYCEDSSPTLANCTITGNTALNGGGVYCDDSSPMLTNCTITGNTATWGGGGGVDCQYNSSPMLTNCIVWNHGKELIGGSADTAAVRYCSVQGGWPGEGNQAEYPMFVNAGAGDYHLRNGSPCIDRGLIKAAPDTDIEGNMRPGADGLVDIGAYESEDGYTPGVVPPRVVYVRAGGAPGGDGDSWPSAFLSVGAALSVAGASDEVWVAAGRYDEAIDPESGVALYGGFAGNETSRGDRNWAANVTAIDATGTGKSAVRMYHVNNVTLDGFVITGGSADRGGGVYCDGSSPTLTNCTITGNTAAYDGGGVYCYSHSSPTLTNCTITGNTATWGGGGGVDCQYNSSPMLTNCAITGNTAAEDGGGLYLDECYPTMTNCTIAGNTAEQDGGGLYCEWDSSPKLANCTITGNTALNGGGVYCDDSSPMLTNCILWNDGTEIVGSGSTSWSVYCSYSNVHGGYPGTGNINTDPGFVRQWDGTSGDFHLLPDSPCVDAGDPELEDGCLPPGLGTARSDMGAYGGPGNCGWLPTGPEPTTTPTPTATLIPTPTALPTPIPGDITGDGIVDHDDLFLFAPDWKKPAGDAAPGCNPISDQAVDEKDLLFLIEAQSRE